MKIMKSSVNKERSLAAKKGWETRRKRQRQQAAKMEGVTAVAAPAANKITAGTISKWFADKGMAQIYGSGLEFAFANAKGEQCHPFAYCKDFLQDAIYAHLNQKKASIYGFQYAYGKNPKLDMLNTRLAVRFKNKKELGNLCQQSLNFLNELDKEMGFTSTTLISGGNYEDGGNEVFIFIGDKRWMHAPVLISLYSLAIRVGLTYPGGGWKKHFESAKSYLGSNDKYYTDEAKTVLDKVVGKDITKVFAAKMEDNYPTSVPVMDLHEYSGIVSMARDDITSSVNKNWGKKN